MAGVLLLSGRHLNESDETLAEGFADSDVLQGVFHRFPAGACPVDQFGIAFGADLVGSQCMENLGGIAAAPGVLQDQGVVELAADPSSKTCLGGDPHT
jgi:hypothetical protein